MDQTLILHRRNKLMAYILWFSLLLGVAVNLVTTPEQTPILLSVGGCIAVGVTVLVWKRWLTGYVMYAVAVSMAVISFVLIDTGKTFPTYLMVYFSMAVCTLYNHFRPVLLSALFALGFTDYFFITERDTLFAAFENDALLTFNLFVILVAGSLIATALFGQRLQKQAAQRQQQVEAAQRLAENMLRHIADTAGRMEQFSTDLKTNVDSTGAISKEMTNGLSEIAKSTENAGSSLNTVHDSLHSLQADIGGMAEESTRLRDLSSLSARLSDEGTAKASRLGERMERLNASMETAVDLIRLLNERNAQVGEIVHTIRDISDQTHLLSLNAAIEASRAGEQGAGFAVVSTEIRKLSEHARQATGHISEMIGDMVAQTALVSEHVAQARELAGDGKQVSADMIDALHDMMGNTHQVAASSDSMAGTAARFRQAADTVAGEMESLSALSEQNMAAVEEITANMENQDRQIADMVEKFHELNAIAGQLREKTAAGT